VQQSSPKSRLLYSQYFVLIKTGGREGLDLTVSNDCIRIGDKAVWNLEADTFIPCPRESNSTQTC